jgi:hypothetical protein
MKIMLTHNRAEYYQSLDQVLKKNKHEGLTEDSLGRGIAAIAGTPQLGDC